ncbi:MAG: AI-2E family transporter [Desulfobaccales bacterium]|jgi:predicted PurR-regulated permease PerM
MEEAGTPKTAAAPPPPQAPGAPETADPEAAAAACSSGPSPEEKSAFPSHFARLFFGAITLLVLYFSYLIIKPYLIDIFLALVLFFTARPLYLGLCRLLRQRTLASALTCLILLLVILIPLFSLMSIIASQALELSSQVTRGMQGGQLWVWIAAKIDALKAYLAHLNLPLPPGDIQLEQIVRTVVSSASSFIYYNAIGLIRGFTYFFLDLLLVLFIAFFMFLQGDAFIDELMKLSPLEPSYNQTILRETEATIKATLWGTVIVAFVQGILGGLGFLIFGLPQPAFWGTVMILASVIPTVGSALIWGPAAIYLLFTGHIAAGLGLIIWGGVVVTIIDNVLKPILMKGGGSTSTIFILFSILGGITYFGMIGFILGPLILSFLLSLLRIYQKFILAPPTVAVPAQPPKLKEPGAP